MTNKMVAIYLETVSKYWKRHRDDDKLLNNNIVKRLSNSINRRLIEFKEQIEDEELKEAANTLIEASSNIMNSDAEASGKDEELINSGDQFINDLQPFIDKLKDK